jgi:hypothetical protein
MLSAMDTVVVLQSNAFFFFRWKKNDN